MLVVAVVGYFLGAVPVAVLVGRARGVDPRKSGDSNAGWWNMRGLVGKRVALAVLAGDVAKGALAALLGTLLVHDWWGPYVGAAAAMVGHALPVFARFRGGKSILVFAGAMAVICPPAVALALCLGAVLSLRRLAPGLQLSMALYPFTQALFQPLTHVAATGCLMTFIGLLFLTARKSDPSTSDSASLPQA